MLADHHDVYRRRFGTVFSVQKMPGDAGAAIQAVSALWRAVKLLPRQ
jgi:hypothetical protein